MHRLKDTDVLRGGFTERYLKSETDEIYYSVNSVSKHFRLHFSIDSKGGGKTRIRIEIGEKDIPIILNAIHSLFHSQLSPHYQIPEGYEEIKSRRERSHEFIDKLLAEANASIRQELKEDDN
ncbi:TPA: hypothetical protein NJ631_002105 [Vibrio parahaemolyticus]|uniref:hypothetical protein n=1 Tax=Vibrio parahaemolyticus TaxID=670 RepID=UPI000944830A|nr:hypothetical protein [Vibrio parahaemolyticus]MBE3889699.1 hypothetical protein [Vibrio parahaemolyticus]MBE3937599.1 hypothetical protein [Vibrio parahaemolyticus]MBE3993141.1 hypothetical protein [Vibrio parahaemolyticus]MDG2676982.1 hypothetical protein [Vibrio parahaemolyticus]OKY31647.1 hypothetical protein BTU71_05635 [Vibrio parahaemolyticus]